MKRLQWRRAGMWGIYASVVLGLAACQPDRPAAEATAGKAAPTMDNTPAATPPPATPGPLKDVIEHDPRYIVGVSFRPIWSATPAWPTACARMPTRHVRN